MQTRALACAAISLLACFAFIAVDAKNFTVTYDGPVWSNLSKSFCEYHKTSVNIFLHGITTPLSILAVVSTFNKVTNTGMVALLLTVLYCLSLINRVPLHILAPSCIVSAAIALTATMTSFLSYQIHIIVFTIAYFGQDVAHFLTSEPTFQGSYQQTATFWSQLAEHTYYLVPLVFESATPSTTAWSAESDSLFQKFLYFSPCLLTIAVFYLGHTGAMVFPWQAQKKRMLMCNLSSSPENVADLQLIRAWAIEKKPSAVSSTHWWYEAPSADTDPDRCLPPDIKAAFARISDCPTIVNMYQTRFNNCAVDVITGMNEVYVSSPTTGFQKTSDEVFYTRHIDGPYYYIPFASCFRTIIGLDLNKEIVTKFPMIPAGKPCQSGDVLAFDFHREVHYIQTDPTVKNDDFRVVLKVHHCIYPPWASFFGKLLGSLSARYNKYFRALFLFTLKPTTPFAKFSAWNVVFWTQVYVSMEEKIGYFNLAYFLGLTVLSLCFGSYKMFLIATSFVHYFRYINTYYYRADVSYGEFKRDVLLFKTASLLQLLGLYFSVATNGFTNYGAVLPTQPIEFVAAAMVIGGYACSSYCTFLLGVDGTYFGIELGYVQADKNYICKFPYGVIPHPMILSQCVAMVGLFMHTGFRTAWPFLVPTHICLYLVHMVQEHFDLYEKKEEKNKLE